MTNPIVGYVGMTHLGINSAVAGAARGFPIIAFHDKEDVVSELNMGTTTVREPELIEHMFAHAERLTFTANPADLGRCDVVYISVDVPTDNLGSSDLTLVSSFVGLALSNMRRDASLVVLCQVPPGFTRSIGWPKEQLFYQVETLIFGKAVERAKHPERFILGVADPRQPIPRSLALYLASFDCPILSMRYESAELAKIAINMFLVSTVTTANILAEICEHLNADWFDIIPALRLDKRIGPNAYLNPGLGIAGGNLERDLRTIINLSATYKTDTDAVKAWLTNSARRRTWVFKKLQELVFSSQSSPVLAIWGLTYKENTNSIRNSAAIDLIACLPEVEVNAYDPAAPQQLSIRGVKRVTNKSDALHGADVLIVMTPWEEFRTFSVSELQTKMRGRVIIDPYRTLAGEVLSTHGFVYACLGKLDLNVPRNDRTF